MVAVWLIRVEFYYFIKYLVEKYSKEVFMEFLYNSFNNPEDIIEQFIIQFKITYGDALKEFYYFLLE